MSTSNASIPAPPVPRPLRFIDPNIFRDIRTYITLTGVTMGIIGLYHYYESVKERAPMYFVSPSRARIVDTSIPAPLQLQVLYKGKDLNTNVSAAIVYFWNAGKLPIKAADILDPPLTVEIDPACEIIDARIVKVSRAVTRIAKEEAIGPAKNSVPLKFSILELNDGVALQIIYLGKPDATVEVKGTIEGAGTPRRRRPEETTFEGEGRQNLLKAQQTMGLAIYTLGCIIGGLLIQPRMARLLYRRMGIPSDAAEILERRFLRGALVIVGAAAILIGLFISVRARLQLDPIVPESIRLEQ